MAAYIAIILSLIFVSLAGIHVYWAFGGKWGGEASIPTTPDGIPIMTPGVRACLIVATGLFCFGMLLLMRAGMLNIGLPQWLTRYGAWAIAGIFLLRAFGDLRYVGFFKEHRQTLFAKNDSRYYSPLCLLIGGLTLVLIVIT